MAITAGPASYTGWLSLALLFLPVAPALAQEQGKNEAKPQSASPAGDQGDDQTKAKAAAEKKGDAADAADDPDMHRRPCHTRFFAIPRQKSSSTSTASR